MSPPPRDDEPFYFVGFLNPTTTPVPDVVFDRLLAHLGEAELKALLYVIRRTFGFKKDRDPISFNQFLKGIVTRDGRQLDEGCGIRNRTALSKALKSLETKGILVSEKGVDGRGENTTTIYRLHFQRGDGEVVRDPYHPGTQQEVVRDEYHGSTQSGPEVVRNSYPQETVQQTEEQQRDLSKGPEIRQGNWKEAPGWCQRFMDDFSREFGDADAIGSNITRVWRIWQKSGIDELHFAPLMYQARTITHKQPFTGYDDEEPDAGGMRRTNRMPYYFRVLEDLVAEEQGAPHVEHPPHPITEDRWDELRRYNDKR